MNDPVAVAVAADDFFAMPLAVTARTVLDRLDPARCLELYVLDGGIAPRNRDRIEASLRDDRCRLCWVDARSARFARLSLRNALGYPSVVFYRLDMGRFVPPERHRVIYIDSDMLVRADLAALFDLDLEGNWLGAVGEYHASPERGGAVADGIYFNAGLLVVDLDQWRAHDAGEIVFDELERRSEQLPFADQDAINVTLRDHLLRLDGRWNQQADLFNGEPDDGLYSPAELEVIRRDPFVVHFTSRPKPWQHGCVHPWRDDWFAAVDRTAWAGFRPSAAREVVEKARRAQRRLGREIRRRAG